MSWAEVQNIKQFLSATLDLDFRESYAGMNVDIYQNNIKVKTVTLDDYGKAIVDVIPKYQYEVIAEDGQTSGKFWVSVGQVCEIGPYNGLKAVPTNDVVIWQKCAGIYNTYKYTTVSQILADTACMNALAQSNNAVDYLMRCTKEESGGMVLSLLSSIDFLRLLGQSPYGCLQAALSSVWSGYINERDMASWHAVWSNYARPASQDLVVENGTWKLTQIDSNATDYSTNTTSIAQTTHNSSPSTITFEQRFTFNKPTVLKMAQIAFGETYAGPAQQDKSTVQVWLEGTIDGVAWTNLGSFVTSPGQTYKFDLANNTVAYKAVRFRSASGYHTQAPTGYGELPLYRRITTYYGGFWGVVDSGVNEE